MGKTKVFLRDAAVSLSLAVKRGCITALKVECLEAERQATLEDKVVLLQKYIRRMWAAKHLERKKVLFESARNLQKYLLHLYEFLPS